MKKINTVVFDFDGTVMDTNRIVAESWQHTFRTLTGTDGSMEYIYSTFGEPLETSMRKTFPDTPVEESIGVYRSYHHERFLDMIELFPGVEDLLGKLKKEGFKLGLATSRMKNTTMQGMDKFNLWNYFDDIVTVEDVTHHKPHPESMLRTLEKLESEPHESVMVGDSLFDIMCGRNAGAKTILVSWSVTLAGMSLDDFSEDEKPDYIAQKAEDILAFLK